MQISNKLAVITGASRGIGRALATALVKSGCDLLLTAFEEDERSTLLNELRSKFSVPLEAMACDLSDLESRKNLIDWIESKENIDILIKKSSRY